MPADCYQSLFANLTIPCCRHHSQYHKRKGMQRQVSLKEDMGKAVSVANLEKIQSLLQEAEDMGISEEPWVGG